MRLRRAVTTFALAFALGVPALAFAQDRDDDDRSVFDDLERTLEQIPKRLEKALGDVKKELDPEKARELKRRLERTLEGLKEAIDPRTEKVRVHVEGRTMDVPVKKGDARLY